MSEIKSQYEDILRFFLGFLFLTFMVVFYIKFTFKDSRISFFFPNPSIVLETITEF